MTVIAQLVYLFTSRFEQEKSSEFTAKTQNLVNKCFRASPTPNEVAELIRQTVKAERETLQSVVRNMMTKSLE